jgi:hypothetical protein
VSFSGLEGDTLIVIADGVKSDFLYNKKPQKSTGGLAPPLCFFVAAYGETLRLRAGSLYHDPVRSGTRRVKMANPHEITTDCQILDQQ